MSRIGNKPVAIPKGVTVKITGQHVEISGPLGKLERTIEPEITMKSDGKTIVFTRQDEEKYSKALHGLSRALVANMVQGVTAGYSKSLIINGVGYKASKTGSKVVMALGFSHPVEVVEPAGIKLNVVTPNEIEVKGIDKEAVGQCAASIRAIKVPDPYHIYGIRYKDEVILKKEGKTAGK